MTILFTLQLDTKSSRETCLFSLTSHVQFISKPWWTAHGVWVSSHIKLQTQENWAKKIIYPESVHIHSCHSKQSQVICHLVYDDSLIAHHFQLLPLPSLGFTLNTRARIAFLGPTSDHVTSLLKISWLPRYRQERSHPIQCLLSLAKKQTNKKQKKWWHSKKESFQTINVPVTHHRNHISCKH